MVYEVKEEVYSDSEEKSSVYTSEDDFEEDEEVAEDFATSFPLSDE
jgi:hypothetical protein